MPKGIFLIASQHHPIYRRFTIYADDCLMKVRRAFLLVIPRIILWFNLVLRSAVVTLWTTSLRIKRGKNVLVNVTSRQFALIIFSITAISITYSECNRFRWSRGSVLAFSTQVRGFKPGRSRRIFRVKKILSTPSFGGEVKPSVPCRRFAPCKRSINLSGSWNLGKITGHLSSAQFHLSLLGSLASLLTYRYLAAKVGTSKGGGKQWQTTPKNVPQDAVCQSHTVHRTGLWFLPTRSLRLNSNEWMNIFQNV